MSISRRIYFNEEEHSYTDNLDNKYISVTTLLGEFSEKFDSVYHARRLAKENNGRGRGRYAGKSYTQILKMWEDEKNAACDQGSTKHNYLETSIKDSSNFVIKKFDDYEKGRLYTINDILTDHDFGRIDLGFFVDKGINERYPEIFNVLIHYVNKGYNIYAEIGVFWSDLLISGLIDVLLVKDDHFIIIDWKTNKDPMPSFRDENGYSVFLPGYFKKGRDGSRNEWIDYKKYLFAPINDLYAVNGVKYTLQLSLYAKLIEYHGLRCKDLILCQIQNDMDNNYNIISDHEIITIHRIKYDSDSIDKLMEHRRKQLNVTRERQLNTGLWN